MAEESNYPTRIAPYGLRMPDDLKARVQAAAAGNNRSMNAEIVATLEEKYPDPKAKEYALYLHLEGLLTKLDAEARNLIAAQSKMDLERARGEIAYLQHQIDQTKTLLHFHNYKPQRTVDD